MTATAKPQLLDDVALAGIRACWAESEDWPTAEFIAKCGDYVPALLGHVEALQAENQRLRNEVNDVRAAVELYQQRINSAIITLRGNKEQP